MSKHTATVYNLKTDTGGYLGTVILTSEGTIASVTDWGNLSYQWASYGSEQTFKEFILGLNVGYFGSKMYQGLSYIAHGRKIEQACDRYAQKILPALQKAIKEELATIEPTE